MMVPLVLGEVISELVAWSLCSPSFFYSTSYHMLGVSHFSRTLLEAVENELAVSAFF